MVSPHLLQDLRLLQRVLTPKTRATASQPRAAVEELFPVIFDSSTKLATAVLKALCQELQAAATDTQQPGRLPSLELFHSASTNLGIRSLTSVARGQLLCFYPARIFPGATPVSELPLGDQLLTNEYENVYLDGKGWLPVHWRTHELAARLTPPILWHGNRLAVGNFLNHPKQGQLPNCVPMVFHWPCWQQLEQLSPAFWARLVPHVVLGEKGQLVRTPSGGIGQDDQATFPAWPHMGMAMFSLRGIQPGEELLLNYRLSAPFPSWYVPVDDAELEAALDAEG